MGKARAKSDDPFKGYRVKGKFKLRDFDPEATPFARGDEAAQRARLDALATELDALQDRLHAGGERKMHDQLRAPRQRLLQWILGGEAGQGG